MKIGVVYFCLLVSCTPETKWPAPDRIDQGPIADSLQKDTTKDYQELFPPDMKKEN